MAEEDQQIAGWLLEHGYELVWREQPGAQGGSDPLESGSCWFEIRHGSELLSFTGPLMCPVSVGVIKATGRLIFRQALVLAKARHLR